MTTVERHTTASPDAVWSVLADGWTFSAWVVGASRVRAVTPEWPAVGATVHHSVGSWPAVLNDTTEVLESIPGRRIVLQARTRPVGEARVEIDLIPDGEGTTIRMSEDFVKGPATVVPKQGRDAALKIRNVETTHRLALLAERRTRP